LSGPTPKRTGHVQEGKPRDQHNTPCVPSTKDRSGDTNEAGAEGEIDKQKQGMGGKGVAKSERKKKTKPIGREVLGLKKQQKGRNHKGYFALIPGKKKGACAGRSKLVLGKKKTSGIKRRKMHGKKGNSSVQTLI